MAWFLDLAGGLAFTGSVLTSVSFFVIEYGVGRCVEGGLKVCFIAAFGIDYFCMARLFNCW